MNNKLYTDALTALFHSIEAYISRRLRIASFDRTIEGTVTASDNTKQLCTIQAEGREHRIPFTSGTFSPGEKITVHLPCNSWRRAQIQMKEQAAALLTLQKAYPVGSIYMSARATNPSTLFGFGTWSPWAAGRMPVGIDASQSEFNTSGKTGGAKTHTLTISEMPVHSHTYERANEQTGVEWIGQGGKGNVFKSSTYNSGGGAPHNNLPPYIVCYMWQRTG